MHEAQITSFHNGVGVKCTWIGTRCRHPRWRENERPLMLALGALGLAQDVTSNGGAGQTDGGKSGETTAKDRTRVTEIVAKGAASAEDKAA